MNLLDIAIAKKMSGGGGSEPTIEALSVTENGTYTAPSGVDGYSPVTVNVPGITPTGTISITQNGTVDVTQYASANINVSGGGGGGDHDAEDGIIARTISGVYENSRVTTVGSYAFDFCTSLASVNLLMATHIGYCAFTDCSNLTTVSLPKATEISNYAFRYCTNLESVYLLAPSVASLVSRSVFQSTPMSLSSYLGYFGSIYVPASLVSAYKTATNWSYYSDKITSYVE